MSLRLKILETATLQQILSLPQSLEESINNQETPEGLVSQQHDPEQPVIVQPPPERSSDSFVGLNEWSYSSVPDAKGKDVRASAGILSEEEVQELYKLNAQQLMIEMKGKSV